MINEAGKKKLTLWLPKEAIVKAKTLAAQLNIPVSHLIEGLVMGESFQNPETLDLEKKN